MTDPQIRVFHDETPLIHAAYCLKGTNVPRLLCILPRDHRGECLPMASPWPTRGAS